MPGKVLPKAEINVTLSDGGIMFKVSSYLSPRRLAVIDATSKTAAFRQTLDLFRDCPYIHDIDIFATEIFKREEVLATGIGNGIGVPHVRSIQVREPVAALTVLRKPVDYGSMDGKPVNIIIMIGMPDGANELYLKYLSKISLKFQNEQVRTAVAEAINVEDLCRIISML